MHWYTCISTEYLRKICGTADRVPCQASKIKSQQSSTKIVFNMTPDSTREGSLVPSPSPHVRFSGEGSGDETSARAGDRDETTGLGSRP